MTDSPEKKASVIILTYNSSWDIGECIQSIVDQTYKNVEIIVVDNASHDNTVDIVKSKYPDIKVVDAGANIGYAAGNNFGIKHSTGDYIVILNPDTVADPDWLQELLQPLADDPKITITTSKIMMFDDREYINTCANYTHFSGLGFCRGLNLPASEYSYPEYVSTISGCSFAIRRETIDALGGFDQDFFLYMEDVDLSWRARLAGNKILLMPTSIIYHKFKLSVAPWKLFYLERNRYMMLFKNYSTKTLLFLIPGLMITEALTWGHAVISGPEYIKGKLKAYYWLVTNIGKIMEKRREIQNNRIVGDRDFITTLEYWIPFGQMVQNKTLLMLGDSIVNPLFKAYYNVIKTIV